LTQSFFKDILNGYRVLTMTQPAAKQAMTCKADGTWTNSSNCATLFVEAWWIKIFKASTRITMTGNGEC